MTKGIERAFVLSMALALLSPAISGCGLLQISASNPAPPVESQPPAHSLISSGPPFLTCKASALPVGAPNVEGWGLQCTLTQAPDGDTHFVVQLMMLDAHGNAEYFFADVCQQQGTLLNGQGDCHANFFKPAWVFDHNMELFAVSLPSKRMSNPVRPLEK